MWYKFIASYNRIEAPSSHSFAMESVKICQFRTFWERIFASGLQSVIWIRKSRTPIQDLRTTLTGVATPTTWFRYANSKLLSIFISFEIDCFHGQ